MIRFIHLSLVAYVPNMYFDCGYYEQLAENLEYLLYGYSDKTTKNSVFASPFSDLCDLAQLIETFDIFNEYFCINTIYNNYGENPRMSGFINKNLIKFYKTNKYILSFKQFLFFYNNFKEYNVVKRDYLNESLQELHKEKGVITDINRNGFKDLINISKLV